MWRLIFKSIKHWWYHSSISKWYVGRLARRYNIDLSQFAFAGNAAPTLTQFMLRKLHTKPTAVRYSTRSILSPVSGIVSKQDAHHITIHMQLHHYHRIHLPIAGSVTHYTRAPYTSTIIHITAPDGLIISVTIATPSEPHATALQYNPRRNYHLQGTEIGCIYAPEATITLQSNYPCLHLFKKNDDLLPSTLLGELPTISLPTTIQERRP